MIRLRIRRLGPNRTTRYFGRLLEADDENGTVTTTKFYYAGDLLVAKDRGGSKSYYHLDHRGSPQLMTDDGAPATEVAKYEYGPFGDVRSEAESAGLENRRGFTGHRGDDETGLVYMGARYYDPVLGRLLSSDPADPQGFAAQAWNRYSYVQNNPLNAFDPTGLDAVALTRDGFSAFGASGGAFVVSQATRQIVTAVAVGAAEGLGVLSYWIGTKVEPYVTPGIQGIYDKLIGYDKVLGYAASTNNGPATVDDILEGASPGPKTRGKTTQYEKPGGFEGANSDFDDLRPERCRGHLDPLRTRSNRNPAGWPPGDRSRREHRRKADLGGP